ncbi:hypothetical protein WT83_27885 [Burkholderia territorii]|uniref:Uncharacterized protein n=1 Tax=Burkholderia territorii TaxID=1503055 RepID=A0A108E734_9BURK|nr:hypothetical protein [Burkholderia territorii]KWN05904.1 hypothetical protein WT83_27885 [Burkholderia territorii]
MEFRPRYSLSQKWLTIVAACRERSLIGAMRLMLVGHRYLGRVDTAVAPRIRQRQTGRAGILREDTGLPDIGAHKLFPREPGTARFFATVALAASPFLIAAGLFVAWGAIVTCREAPNPLYALLPAFFAFILLQLTTYIVVSAAWELLNAAELARTTLGPGALALLRQIIEKNRDACPASAAALPRTYGELADFIADLRYALARLEAGRSI